MRRRRDEAVIFLGNDIISLEALEISKSLTASDSTASRPSVKLAGLSPPQNVCHEGQQSNVSFGHDPLIL